MGLAAFISVCIILFTIRAGVDPVEHTIVSSNKSFIEV